MRMAARFEYPIVEPYPISEKDFQDGNPTRQKDHSADTSAIERQIDRMVYELYGLTEEEIKVVDE